MWSWPLQPTRTQLNAQPRNARPSLKASELHSKTFFFLGRSSSYRLRTKNGVVCFSTWWMRRWPIVCHQGSLETHHWGKYTSQVCIFYQFYIRIHKYVPFFGRPHQSCNLALWYQLWQPRQLKMTSRYSMDRQRLVTYVPLTSSWAVQTGVLIFSFFAFQEPKMLTLTQVCFVERWYNDAYSTTSWGKGCMYAHVLHWETL